MEWFSEGFNPAPHATTGFEFSGHPGARWPLGLLSDLKKFQLCVINTTISLHLKGTKHMQFHILQGTNATDLSYFISPP